MGYGVLCAEQVSHLHKAVADYEAATGPAYLERMPIRERNESSFACGTNRFGYRRRQVAPHYYRDKCERLMPELVRTAGFVLVHE